MIATCPQFHLSCHCEMRIASDYEQGKLFSNDNGFLSRVVSRIRTLSLIMDLVPQYLSADEEAQIHQQFQGGTWQLNNQVLWSGIPREEAQRWADERKMQTLTTAMGPLMDPSHPLCLRIPKSTSEWSQYVKGASALFAWYISKGERVTVLSPPPPERFNPCGQTNYQMIEEPIVKGVFGTGAVSRIVMVHPDVSKAENFSYQVWPVDETDTWTRQFGTMHVQKRAWRTIKTQKALSINIGGMEIAKDAEEKPKGSSKAKMLDEKSKQQKRIETVDIISKEEEAKEKGKAKEKKKKRQEAKAAKIERKEAKAKAKVQVGESGNKQKKKKDKKVKKEEKVKAKAETKKSKKEKKKDKKVKKEKIKAKAETNKSRRETKEEKRLRKKYANKLKREKWLDRITRGGPSPEVGKELVGMNVIRGDLLIGLMLIMVLVPGRTRALL
ncbi:hypothetical protein BKA64DRAFT_670400 [Cadophora sp. MPI-SDFR-AT-0126]|nr:hypothetical protein BKA64DRAFT_670400 [Leotiomycetes sp. MPI-SDFR-AT-0126]